MELHEVELDKRRRDVERELSRPVWQGSLKSRSNSDYKRPSFPLWSLSNYLSASPSHLLANLSRIPTLCIPILRLKSLQQSICSSQPSKALHWPSWA